MTSIHDIDLAKTREGFIKRWALNVERWKLVYPTANTQRPTPNSQRPIRIMAITVTDYLDVISSWCFWSEPTWAELKKRYQGQVRFQWMIAFGWLWLIRRCVKGEKSVPGILRLKSALKRVVSMPENCWSARDRRKSNSGFARRRLNFTRSRSTNVRHL